MSLQVTAAQDCVEPPLLVAVMTESGAGSLCILIGSKQVPLSGPQIFVAPA